MASGVSHHVMIRFEIAIPYVKLVLVGKSRHKGEKKDMYVPE
jgi:hypothetical protein